MKFILGKKIEMTQIWKGDDVVAVTKVQAGPCKVVQVKNKEKDGYEAVQLGFGDRKEKNIAKPQKGHLAKVGMTNVKALREFRIANGKLNAGDIIDVTNFKVGDMINVVSVSKGKGFQGVVKRHGFKGQPMTHGHKDQNRMPGSIGSTGPQHVFKGKRMGGRTGGDRVTVKNQEIIEVDAVNNVLYIKGGVPGARNTLVMIMGEGEITPVKMSEPQIITESTEATEVIAQVEEVKVE